MLKTTKFTTKYMSMVAIFIAVLFLPITNGHVAFADSKGGYSGGYGGYSNYTLSSPSYSSPSYSYSQPSYSYSQPSSYSSYIPSAAQRYVYSPTSGGSSGYQSAPQLQYVYSSNANTNKNTNANSNSNTNNNSINNTFNPTNVFNPTNNNDINVVVLGAGTQTPTTPVNQALSGYCVITPSTAYVNQEISFTASASGGTGSYTYQWSGDNGLYSSSQSFTGRFSYAGNKTATVVIRSGSESITKTCTVYVQEQYYQPPVVGSNVTVIRDQNLGTPVSGVFLNQVPDTGINFGLKMTLFVIGLVLWSVFAAYVISRKTKTGAALAASASAAAGSMLSKAQAFKLANMQKKGLIA